MSKKDKKKNQDSNNGNSSPLLPSKKVMLCDLTLQDKLLLKGDITASIIQRDDHRIEVSIPDDYVMVVYQVDNGPFAGGYGTFFLPKNETTRVVKTAPEIRKDTVASAVSYLNPMTWTFFNHKGKKKDNNKHVEDKKDN